MKCSLLVVGGGIAAVKTVEAARSAGYSRSIVIVSDESALPYDRPPLSKQALAQGASPVLLWEVEDYKAHDVLLKTGIQATRLDREHKTVYFNDGQAISYEQLVIATGARAREFPGEMPRGIHTIRTLQDAADIAGQLAKQPSVVVIGAGFIGAEVASTARSMGCEVTILEAGQVALHRVLGPIMGKRCETLHESRGIKILTNQKVLGFVGSDFVQGVQTEEATHRAELVIIGIGAMPNVEWLSGSGVPVSNGVLCDEKGRVLDSDSEYAVGDVASWVESGLSTHKRHEHWSSATEHAKIVGQLLAGDQREIKKGVPYFWSDQHGIKIQMLGVPETEDQIEMLNGDLEDDSFLVAYHKEGQASALLSFGMPRKLAKLRKTFVPGQPVNDIVGALL